MSKILVEQEHHQDILLINIKRIIKNNYSIYFWKLNKKVAGEGVEPSTKGL